MPSLVETADFFCRHCAVDRGGDALHLPNWTVDDWVALLTPAHPVHLARKEVLIRHGENRHSLFLVASGALEVQAGRGRFSMGSLFREDPGSVIGEIAFFDGGMRSATVWAIEPSDLLELERGHVDAFAAQRPARAHELLFALGRVLAFHVRRSEQRPAVDAF